jgi:hypothetical protein
MEKSTVEIYTVVKDDGTHLPFFIDHYKKAFPGCTFIIHNNGCTASVLNYLKDQECIVNNWGPYNEKYLQTTKNTCWRNSKADWVIVCDVDEIADVTIEDIENLPKDVQVLSFQGYQMLSRKIRPIPLEDLTHGVLDDRYSKYIMFKPRPKAVVYDMGAHNAIVSGIKSSKVFSLLHYNQGYLKNMNNSKMRHYLYKNIHRILDDK